MNKLGQSIIEYTLITVLVILGIYVMGPYVLRSVGAHFKLWDEGVQTSFEENIEQASVTTLPIITPPPCTCTPTTGGACGSTAAGAFCAPCYREVDFTCNPQGCNIGTTGNSPYCKPDNSCCNGWGDLGCGYFPLPTDASGNIDLTLETTSQTPPVPPASNNCYYGQEIQGHPGSSDPTIQCVPPPSNAPSGCMPICFGTIPSNAVACPGALANLTTSLAIGPIGSGIGSCTGAKCQYYFPCSGSPTNASGTCPGGSFWQSGCPVNYYCTNASGC